ncbi:uncharacterized protein LOC114536042 [Dendronephthya gigantea]|uniref:uncharacterized protein LOC114536042 n=1 Tax=Dendronephthya gigantea TaxID=151771 RepID=UPI00106AE476|nr:uncharacterized protein LOC114536042 [Dendronephthya gigantea]
MNFESGEEASGSTSHSQIAAEKVSESEVKNDGATLGLSLIKFMTLATGSVKTALQKPANYKKNINHRRYLQKQLKICPRRKKRSGTKAKTGPKVKTGASKQALGTATQGWYRQTNCHGGLYMNTNPNQGFATNNNIYLPREASGSEVGLGNAEYHSQEAFANSTNFQNGFIWNQQQTDCFATQQIHSTSSYRDDTMPFMLYEETEQFLTGEELTHALDINDLFVPERSQENNEDVFKYSSCTLDENMYNIFQTVPSTTSILSW